MGKILFCGNSGKRDIIVGGQITSYLNSLDEDTRRKYISAYGLQHIFKEFDDENEVSANSTIDEDATSDVGENQTANESTPGSSSSITTIEAYTPIFDSKKRDSNELTVATRVFYEVDLDKTNELHSSISLDILRNQLKASSQTDKASKQLVGLEGKHPSAVCGVLCKKIISQESIKNADVKAKPPLRVRLKCSKKVVEQSGDSSAESRSKESLTESPKRQNSTPQRKIQTRGSRRTSTSPEKESSKNSSPLKTDKPNQFGALDRRRSTPIDSPKSKCASPGSVKNLRKTSSIREEEEKSPTDEESRLLESKESTDNELLKEASLETFIAVDDDDDDDSEVQQQDSLLSKPKRRRARLPQRFLDSSSKSLSDETAADQTVRRRRKTFKKDIDDQPEPETSTSTENEAATVTQSESGEVPSKPASAAAEPVPCEICEMVNKQRPVFYFHGHQVCRVCSNFLTSTLRKLSNIHDAACIYDRTCDSNARYCRNCRLYKFLLVGFDLSRFGKMRGFPEIILDLSMTSLVEPAVVHAARLDRVTDYAKYLNTWRTNAEMELKYATYTPIPSVTRQKPPLKKLSPSKHRRPVWHEESEEESPSKPSSDTKTAALEFDSQRVVSLSKEVPFSCDICSEREELYRIDNISTVCSECLNRYKSLLSCHSDEKSLSCSSGISNCINFSTCQACFLERCRQLVPESTIGRSSDGCPKKPDNDAPVGKTLFESRIPGSEATALADLECVICRLIAASTKGQLNFYHLKFCHDAQVEEGYENEGVTVCETCLWNYQWRVEEARTVEEFICPNNRSCKPHECHPCLVQKCRAILPLHNDLRLPDWIKAVMFERLSVNRKKEGTTEDEAERMRRVCKVKNATIPSTPPPEEVPSHEVPKKRGRPRGRGRGRGRGFAMSLTRSGYQRRGRGRSKAKIGEVSKVRTKMPSNFRRRRSTTSSEGKEKAMEDEANGEEKDGDDQDEEGGSESDDTERDSVWSKDKPRRSRRKRRVVRLESSDDEKEEEKNKDEKGVEDGDEEDEEEDDEDEEEEGEDEDGDEGDESESQSDTNSTAPNEAKRKGDVVTTRILRAGGTKGPRIKQVSRHAATVFSRASKKNDSDGSRPSRRKRKSATNGDVKSRLKTARTSNPPHRKSDEVSVIGSTKSKTSIQDESELLSDVSSDFNTREKVIFAQVSPDNGSGTRKRACGRCVGCKRTVDCGKCRFCRNMTKFGGRGTTEKCQQRICNNHRSDTAARISRESQATAWVRELQAAAKTRKSNDQMGGNRRNRRSSDQYLSQPVHKTSGAPPSNTLWNTVHGLSRQIDEAHSSGIYADQEVERIRCNLSERQATNLAWDGGVAVVTTRKYKPPGELCYLCGSAGPHKMIYCVSCSEPFHWFCLEYADRPRSTTETAIWLCRNCKPCLLCHHTGGVLTCVSCWKGFHARCLPGYGPAQQPNRNAWLCPGCAVCNRCGSCAADILPHSGTVALDSLPLSSRSREWSLDPGLCAECEAGSKKGNVCPVCQRVYSDLDQEMIQCSECNLWVHAHCAGLRNEDYHALSSMNPRHLSKLVFVCRRCEVDGPHEDHPTSNGDLQTSARVELRARVRSLLHTMAAREVEMVEETKAIEEGFANRCPVSQDVDDDDDVVPQVDGVIDAIPVESEQVGLTMPPPRPMFPELLTQLESCDPWGDDDPLRFGITYLIKHVMCSLDERMQSDNFGLQYQTYASLVTEFETQVGQQLSWFDLQALKKRLQRKRRIRSSYSCSGSTVGDSEETDTDDEVQLMNKPVHIKLYQLPSSLKDMEAEAEESDTLWMDYWYRYDRNLLRSLDPDDQDKSDLRECALCRQGGENAFAGRLLFSGQDMWVHANCALWSNEVYETEEGSLRHVGEAVLRGSNTNCRICRQRGATLSCCGEEITCTRSFHFTCGIQAGCIFTVDRAFFCSVRHATGVSREDVLSMDDLAVCRRVLIHREGFRGRKAWTSGLEASQIRITIGALTVDWLGRIDEASDSLTSFLCPVGFRCTRMYWSAKHVAERLPYRLSVHQTNVDQTTLTVNNSTTVHAPIIPVEPPPPPIPPPLPEPEPELQSLRSVTPTPSLPPLEEEPQSSTLPPPMTVTLADRLQQLSREMVAAKRTAAIESSDPHYFVSNVPVPSSRPVPAPRISSRKSQHFPRVSQPEQPIVLPGTNWRPIAVNTNPAPTRPQIASVRSLQPEEPRYKPTPPPSSEPPPGTSIWRAPTRIFSEDLQSQIRTVMSSISPPITGASIWKTSNQVAQRPAPRIIPSCVKPQRAERATMGNPKRPNPDPSPAPETKRLRLTNHFEEVHKPLNKLIVTRKISNGKTVYVCLNSAGVTPAGGVQKVVHPVRTVVRPNTNGVLPQTINVVPKPMTTPSGVLSTKIDRIVDRVLVNPPLNPPPQLDGCADEAEEKAAIKDPPKLKTRWIEERDKKDYLKSYLANVTSNQRRRKTNIEVEDHKAQSEHLAAISRAKRKHDERRYRKATADVQESYWLTFCVESEDLPNRVCTMSPRLSWKQVTSQVKDFRYENGWRHPYIFGVDGWSQWGISHRILAYIIEQMEGAYLAYRHRFIYHRKKIEALRELNAPPVPCKRGCARAEPYPKQAWRLHETFSFLLCSVNHSGTSLAPSQTSLSIDDEVTSSTGVNPAKLLASAPLATRLRQLSCRRGTDVEVFRSPIHCRGLFALHSFAKDEMITEYLGEVIRSIVCEERERKYQEAHVDCFMFRIDSESVIDATMKGNAARFINHSCNPNCYSRVITMPDTTKHIVILAQRDIQRGEELTYDYKFPAEDDKIPCHCGANNCRRFLN